MYRQLNGAVEVLLAHPGGPYFAKKDDGAWTVPKGEPDPGEDDLLTTARREFQEETGVVPTADRYLPLGSITQKGGKVVHAWALEGDCDQGQCHSNLFSMEWPPKSGKLQEFPEMDRAAWFPLAVARVKIKASQVPLLERLEEMVRTA